MSISPIHSLPRWLKRNVPKGGAGRFTARLIEELGLQTVCDHAKCPNRMECYSRKTATFMILGDVCTRGCRFCSVKKGKPQPLDPDEPRRVAEAVYRLGLKHVVITCVTRDDLSDGGAEHFVQTIKAIREGPLQKKGDRYVLPERPGGCRAQNGPIPFIPTIEVLPSDFGGNAAAVDRLVEAAPEVYNHNVETVPRLFPAVRGAKRVMGTFCRNGPEGASHKMCPSPFSHAEFPNYRWTLETFRRIRAKNPSIALKTGMMLGLGETTDELLEVWADLLDAGCRMLTLGQYLQPSPAQIPVVRYVPPEEFERLGELARRMGFGQVASGPFVRSSYRAREMLGEAANAPTAR
ncbi:MAG: lipoyl synthase [Pirellulales bacterium]|nr:lipoyl synthase [Pirellulales bacterium]